MAFSNEELKPRVFWERFVLGKVVRIMLKRKPLSEGGSEAEGQQRRVSVENSP